MVTLEFNNLGEDVTAHLRHELIIIMRHYD